MEINYKKNSAKIIQCYFKSLSCIVIKNACKSETQIKEKILVFLRLPKLAFFLQLKKKREREGNRVISIIENKKKTHHCFCIK